MQCVAEWVSMYAVALLSSQESEKCTVGYCNTLQHTATHCNTCVAVCSQESEMCTVGYFANTQAAPVAVALLPSHFSFHLQNLLLRQWLVCHHRSNSSGLFYCSCNGQRDTATGPASIMAKEPFLVAMCEIFFVLAKETGHHQSNSNGLFFSSCDGQRAIAAGAAFVMANGRFLVAMCDISFVCQKRHHIIEATAVAHSFAPHRTFVMAKE